MENQHRKIKGYPELSQEEIDLVNEIKDKGVELQALLDKCNEHITKQIIAANNAADSSGEKGRYDEMDRIDSAQPRRWLSIARTHFQEGSMALTRSVAQPEFF